MTDEDALLRAIADHPEDELPRRVYADWLAERGDPREVFLREPTAEHSQVLDPVWLARVSRPPQGILTGRIRFSDTDEKRPRLTTADLNWLEARHRLTLPSDYRAFLLNVNGGTPNPGHFRIPGREYTTGQYEIAVHFSTMFAAADVEDESDYDLLWRLQHLDEYRQVETRWQGETLRDLMIVGLMPPGDLDWICLGCRGTEIGKIYAVAAWMDDDSQPDRAPLAPSFAAFLDMLGNLDPPHIQAINTGNLAELVPWLDAGGDKDEVYRNAPLVYHAVFHGRAAILRELLSRGARTWDGLLQDAERFRKLDVIRALREHTKG